MCPLYTIYSIYNSQIVVMLDARRESDVYRRQILTSKVNPKAELHITPGQSCQ